MLIADKRIIIQERFKDCCTPYLIRINAQFLRIRITMAKLYIAFVNIKSQSFLMHFVQSLYNENFSMCHYAGLLQIGSHLVVNNWVVYS